MITIFKAKETEEEVFLIRTIRLTDKKISYILLNYKITK